MAGKVKSNSNRKKNTKKNVTMNKKNNNSIKKKSTASTKKKNTVKKVTATKNNVNNLKKKNTAENTKKVVPVTMEKASIREEFDSLKKLFLEKKKEFIKRFNNSPKYIKYLALVCLLCSLLLITEGIIFMSHRIGFNSGIIYHDTYTGVISDDNSIIVVGNSDFKNKGKKRVKDNSHGKLVKYKLNGEIVFEKTYDKGIATTFNSIISVNDGYIVVGTGIFSKEEEKKEAREAFIIKFGKDGELIWEKFYQVLTNTSFKKVVATSDGYIAVGQSIYANNELGNHTTGGAIIVKYDKDGNVLWHNNHGGTKSGNFNDVVVASDNSIYAVGKDGADYSNLVKFSSDGEYLWHKNYGYTDSFGFGGIAYLDNYLYVVGSKKILPPGTTDQTEDRSTTDTDAVLIKYDMDGNIVFEKMFGGSSFERYNSIMMYQNNFYVIGHICSHDAGLKVINDDKEEMTGLIVRYDINGNILKKETIGGSNNDNLTAITTDGISFYTVGYSNSKNGNIATSKGNGRDYLGQLIKLNKRFKVIYSK